jgi:Lon protease-like protein
MTDIIAPPESVGVFALPRLVVFPGAVFPLHVFEPRYRALVRDALAGDRSFALALLRPGYEKAFEGIPDIYPVGCVARIEEVVPLPDGRFLLTLTGTERVEFHEMVSPTPYRRHRVRYLPDRSPDEWSTPTREMLLRLVSAYQQIAGAVSGRESPAPLPTAAPFATTVNRIAFSLDLDPEVKYGLLEDSQVLTRAETLVALLEAALPGYLKLNEDTLN